MEKQLSIFDVSQQQEQKLASDNFPKKCSICGEVDGCEHIEGNQYTQPIKSRIEQLRRMVLVHSFIYYRLGTSVITDQKFDRLCQELVNKQDQYSEIADKAKWADAFSDFDGTSSGYDLPLNDEFVFNKAYNLLKNPYVDYDGSVDVFDN